MEQDVESLRRQFAIPGTISIERDAHGLARVEVTAPAAEACVYLHGAHVTHYQPRGDRPVLFMSRQSHFAPGKPIRGGVPIIFPWFGPHPTDPARPAHGWARTRPWTLRHADRDDAGHVRLTFSLGAGEQGAEPVERFLLTYDVVIGPELRMELTVENRADAEATFEEALHTYLAVGDVRPVRVHGLSGGGFIDKVDGMKRKTQKGPVAISREVDRVYLDTKMPVTVDDPATARTIVVRKAGSSSTVVWNPWVDKAKAMSDFGDDEWQRMLCVETANVADDTVTLAPGMKHVMTAVVRVE